MNKKVSYDEAIEVFWKMYDMIFDNCKTNQELKDFNDLQEPLQRFIKENANN